MNAKLYVVTRAQYSICTWIVERVSSASKLIFVRADIHGRGESVVEWQRESTEAECVGGTSTVIYLRDEESCVRERHLSE